MFGGAVSFPPGERMADVQAEIETAINDVAAADAWLRDHPPSLEWVSGTTGVELSEDHPLYRTVSAAVRTVTGTVPSVNSLHTASDIRNPAVQKGIPTVGLGPRCGSLTQAGGTDEWIDVDDYIDMIKVAALIVADWTAAVTTGDTETAGSLA
jgi:acetylornithine deacetylase